MNFFNKGKIKNKSLEEKILEIEQSEGYMIVMTKREGDKLTHTTFINNFRKDDIFSSLDEYAKLLEKETK